MLLLLLLLLLLVEKMSNMDRFTIHSQLQHLQSKYPGTGNADTTRLYVHPNTLNPKPFEPCWAPSMRAIWFSMRRAASCCCMHSVVAAAAVPCLLLLLLLLLRRDWGLHIQRDTLASHVGHYSR